MEAIFIPTTTSTHATKMSAFCPGLWTLSEAKFKKKMNNLAEIFLKNSIQFKALSLLDALNGHL